MTDSSMRLFCCKPRAGPLALRPSAAAARSARAMRFYKTSAAAVAPHGADAGSNQNANGSRTSRLRSMSQTAAQQAIASEPSTSAARRYTPDSRAHHANGRNAATIAS
jgi:hypothetical protein